MDNKIIMWIVYAVLIAILGVVGYYVGKNYTAIGSTIGAGVGVATGAIVSWAIHAFTSEDAAAIQAF